MPRMLKYDHPLLKCLALRREIMFELPEAELEKSVKKLRKRNGHGQ